MATIGFSVKFPWGEETHFVPKIWEGIIEYGLFPQWASLPYLLLAEGKNLDYIFKKEGISPKIHTIREDKADLWKPGRKIHPVVFNRTKDRFQFAPVLECKSVQRIEVIYAESNNHKPKVIIDENIFYNTLAGINKGMEKLARNDGFDSAGDFFRFFNKDFTGKIIHWTDFHY